ncbi:MAG: 4Fe-4S dicluster domain-containing protein [Chloroflexi bacterium]|nr:4Fe-4S dicluster domain-containing protein [Chloroflexota bacterium]
MPEFACPPGLVCRPTFWNIPEWLQIAVYLGGLVAILIFAYGLWLRVQHWRKGKGTFSYQPLGERLKQWLVMGVATKKVALDHQPAGAMHVSLMWGMIILFIGTALATIDWDITKPLIDGKQWRLLQGDFYFLYKVVLDIFGLLALIGLTIAFVIRYGVKPERLDGRSGKKYFREDLWIIGALLLIVVTGFLIEALRLAGQPAETQKLRETVMYCTTCSVIGFPLAQLFAGIDLNTLKGLHVSIWILHAVAALTLIGTVSFTKMSHFVVSSVNTFFKKLEPAGAIPKIQDIENQESFGISKLEEFTWKQLLDFDACTRCGRCQDACPAALTGKALSPKNVIVKLFEVSNAKTPGAIHNEVIDAQELWDCTTCMGCVNACPVSIDQLGTIIDLRRYLTLSEGSVQPSGAGAMNSMERQGNPYGFPKQDRHKWMQGLDVPFADSDTEYDVLFWVGCAGAYDQRAQKISKAFVKILQTAGIKFAVMQEERCNCESARRLGNEYLYQMATMEIVESLKQYKFKRIVTTCPHCLNTIKNEYPQFDGKFEVVHHTELINGLIADKRISPKRMNESRVTYHDSCYLGRYNGIFDPQRHVLQAVGANLVEMRRARANGLCCGGGGGRMWLEENTGTRINNKRFEDVIAVNAQTVASACPFCMTMLDDGAKALSVDEQIARKDIAELVAEAL